MKKVLFSGGGTGGHIYPALAIREVVLEKRASDVQTAYMGVADGMEAGIVARLSDLPFFPVSAQGMPRTLSWKWLSFPLQNLRGLLDSWRQMRAFRPDLVVTTGGFVAFPCLWSAWLMGIPFVLHEQNAAMGFTNRLFAGRASRVLLTYAEAYAEKSDRVVLTGNPVRGAFRTRQPIQGRFPKKPGEFWILAVGGSRGATSLNRACVELARDVLPRHPELRLLQITGERDYEEIKAQVPSQSGHVILPYLHEMREAFGVADLLVSRAGATILAEIACEGKPAILVPYPHATDNHQEKNARILETHGAARVLLDHELSGARLEQMIVDLRTSGSLSGMAEAMKKTRPEQVEERLWKAIEPLLT